jgi:hypothetical protein
VNLATLLEPKVVQSIGLLLDAGGILLLFKYQIDFNRDVGTGPVTSVLSLGSQARDPSEEARYRKYVRRTYLGMALILIGFLFQAVALWL